MDPSFNKNKIYKWRADDFFRQSSTYFDASEVLFNSNFMKFLNVVVILDHFALELLLKGFLIWQGKNFTRTHDLLELVNLNQFTIDEEEQKQLQKVNTFFDRYPLDAQEFETKLHKLNNIGYQSIPGINDAPDEIGTDDKDLINKVRENLVTQWIKNTFRVQRIKDSLVIRYPHILLYWDFDKNKVSPEKITINCEENFFWQGKCRHSWQGKINVSSLITFINWPDCPECNNNLIDKINDL